MKEETVERNFMIRKKNLSQDLMEAKHFLFCFPMNAANINHILASQFGQFNGLFRGLY